MATSKMTIPHIAAIRGYTLRELAFEELRRAILAGRFAPGEAITIRELAEQMNLGVMPVREGVQQLASLGALEFLPNRSVRVPHHGQDELRKIFEARSLLEGYATEQAAALISPRDIATLRRLLKMMKFTASPVDSREALENNYRFHFTIYQASQSRYIVEMIEKLWLRIGPLHLLVFQANLADQDEFFSVLPLHAELIDALHAREGGRAGKIMRDLLQSSLGWYDSHALPT
jgi:DNA-binding GntR family transcriptional regulator